MGAVRMTRRGKWVSESAQRYLAYKTRIGHTARKQFSEPLSGPVAVEICFRYPIPRSWSKKRSERALEGLDLPTVKPDIDNCVKGIFDALNKIAWKDDAQVVALVTRKDYAAQEGMVIKVWSIDEEESAIV